MKTSLQELPENRVLLTVEVPVADVDHAFQHALSDLSQSVRMPGFRKGKAPAALVKQRIGQDALREEALDSHIDGWYRRAVAEAGIDPVDRPRIDFEDGPIEGAPFAFSAEVAVKPPPQVKAYKGLEGVRVPVEVPREAIDAELQELRLSVAELVPVERGAAEPDFVVADIVTAGGRQSDFSFTLGEGMLPPDLERGVTGMKPGDHRELTISQPDGEGTEVVEVHVKDVKERKLPALDDDFATTVSEFDNLAELEADIRDRRHRQLALESDQVFRLSVLDALGRELTTAVPETLVRSRMAEMLRRLVEGLEARGLSTEQYLRMTGQTSEEVTARLRAEAVDAVTKDLALEAVADAEAVDLSDDQVAAWIREQAGEAEEDPEQAVHRLMDDPAMLTALRNDLRMQKALDICVDNAKEISPEQARARAQLWTPEQESGSGSGKPSAIWTPGSGEPATT